MSPASDPDSGIDDAMAGAWAALHVELDELRRERDELAAENARLRQALSERNDLASEVFEDGTDGDDAFGQRGGRLFGLGAEQGVDAASTAEVKLALFRDRFRGRDDVHAVRWENASTGASGYAPAVAGGWAAAKRSGRRDYLPLTDEVLGAHLRGHQTVGLFPLLGDDTCWLLACDFDGPGWQLDVQAFHDICLDHGVPVAIKRSRSGQGGHAWIFFSSPVAAVTARRLGVGLLRATADQRGELDLATYDRLCPSQDLLPTGGLGNLIALPLQGKARRDGNSVFIDPADGTPIADQWAFLAGTGRMAADEVAALADDLVQPVTWQELADGRTRPRRDRTSERSAPSPLVGTLATGIHLETSGWPPWLVSEVKHLASLHNPDYYRRQKRRMSTHDTPRNDPLLRPGPHPPARATGAAGAPRIPC